jgi:hypothetical protein
VKQLTLQIRDADHIADGLRELRDIVAGRPPIAPPTDGIAPSQVQIIHEGGIVVRYYQGYDACHGRLVCRLDTLVDDAGGDHA